MRSEIAKVDDVGLTYLVGETGDAIRVAPDTACLALYSVTLQQLSAKITAANSSFPAGTVRNGGEEIQVVAGEALQSPAELANLLLTTRESRPVYVRDVADISFVQDTADL